MACKVVYKGVEYDFADFAEKLHDGLLEKIPELSDFKAPERPIGFTQAKVEKMREEKGLPELEKLKSRSREAVYEDAKSKVESGDLVPDTIIEKVNNGENLNETEVAALHYNQVKLLNSLEDLQGQYDKALEEGREKDVRHKNAEMDEVRMQLDRNSKALYDTSSLWGKVGAQIQEMIKKDFSYAGIERRMMRKQNGKELSKEQKGVAEKLSKDIEGLTSKLEELTKAKDNLRKQIETDLLNRVKGEIVEEYKSRAQAKRRAKTKANLDKAKADFRNAMASMSSGGLQALPEFIKLVKAYVEDGIVRAIDFVKSFREDFPESKYTDEQISEAFDSIYGEEKNKEFEDIVGELKEDDFLEFEDMKPLLDRMFKNRVEAGAKTVEEAINPIYEAIRENIPDKTKDDVRDLISGYGEFREKTPNEIRDKMAEIRLTARLEAKLEATEKGLLPLRNGFERSKKTKEQRDLIKQIAKNIKEKKLTSQLTESEKAKQYASALEAHHRQLENAIEDVQKELADNKRREKAQGKVYTDTRTKELEAQLEDLRRQREEKLPKEKKPLSEEQRLKIAENNVGRNIRKTQEEIARLKNMSKEDIIKEFGNVANKEKLKSERLTKLKEELGTLKDQREELIPEYIKNKALVDKFKKSKERSIKNYEDRLKYIQEYGQKIPKKEPKKAVLDDEAQILLDKLEEAKGKVAIEEDKIKYQESSAWKKLATFARDVKRAEIFTSFFGMTKLALAAVSRIAIHPLEVGSKLLLSKIAPNLAKKNYTTYAPDAKSAMDQLKYYYKKESWQKAMEAAKHSFGAESEYQSKFGHNKYQPKYVSIKVKGKEYSLGDILRKPQEMHAFMKAFPKIMKFEQAYNTALDNMKAEGLDINKPVVKNLAVEMAKREALTDIFMEDQSWVTAINEAIDKGIDSDNPMLSVVSTILSTHVPVIKVPTNFALQVLDHVPMVGLADALLKIKRSGEKGGKEGGVENLTHEQAQKVTRKLNAQIFGTVLTATGITLYMMYGDDAEDYLEENAFEGEGNSERVSNIKRGYFLHNVPTDVIKTGIKIGKLLDEGEGPVKSYVKGVGEEAKEMAMKHPLKSAGEKTMKTIEGGAKTAEELYDAILNGESDEFKDAAMDIFKASTEFGILKEMGIQE